MQHRRMDDEVEMLEEGRKGESPLADLKKMPMKTRLRRLFALAKDEVPTLIIASIALGVSSGVNMLIPQFLGQVIDAATKTEESEGKDMLKHSMLLLFFIFIIGSFFTFVRASLFTISGERVVTKLRILLFDKIISQEMTFFDKTRVGEVINRLSADCSVIQNSVTVNVSMALRNVFQLLAGIIILFTISYKLTLLMLLIVPAVSIGAVKYGKFVKKISKQVQDALADATVVAEETLGNIRTVRSFAAEKKQCDKYNEATQHSFQLSKKRAIAYGAFSGGAFFLGNIAFCIVLYFGGSLVLSHEMSIGTLTSFILYTVWVAVALAMLSSLFNDLMKALGATTRVFELLDREPEINNDGGEELDTIVGNVEFRNVTFCYATRDFPVLKDFNFHLEPNRVTALVGPSGGGKSTVAALLSRFYDPQQGGVFLDSHPLPTLSPPWLRRQIGIVLQEPILFATSLRENICYGKTTATMIEIESAVKLANVENFLNVLPNGIDTTVGERGVRLSGGQKQRVAIARAILLDPKILILDEATSALDGESERLVHAALSNLMKNRTVLVIAHRLSTVEKADVLAVLEGGGIKEIGTHDVLIKKPDGIYRRLVEMQMFDASKQQQQEGGGGGGDEKSSSDEDRVVVREEDGEWVVTE